VVITNHLQLDKKEHMCYTVGAIMDHTTALSGGFVWIMIRHHNCRPSSVQRWVGAMIVSGKRKTIINKDRDASFLVPWAGPSHYD
jgi:hypothetical protein